MHRSYVVLQYIYSVLNVRHLNRFFTNDIYIYTGVPGRKVSILEGHSIGHSNPKKGVYRYTCPIPNGFRDRAMDVIARIKAHRMHSDEQHAMSSHELQSALMLTWNFR
jgi:hypothetical protein